MRIATARLLAPISLALVGCRPAPSGPPPRPAIAGPAVAVAAPVEGAPAGCVPPLPAAPTSGLVGAGPAYVLVEGVGVLKISDAGVALALASGAASWGTSMVVAPDGALWMSDWEGVRVLAPGGEVRQVRAAHGGPRYEALAVRSPTDAWAVTSDIEWTIVRYDGARWTPVRRRADFTGKYDDDKLEAMAVTGDAVWVSSWNGLWRGAGDDWRPIDPPGGTDSFARLWVYRDRLIAGYREGTFVREGTTWTPLAWPTQGSLQRVVGDVGLVVVPAIDGATVTIAPAVGEGCAATSEAVPGSRVDAVAVDAGGRVWLATDHALAVLDRAGRELAAWTPGTLAGLTGKIERIAVVGAGPSRLPAPQPARTWEISGRLKLYRSGAPLANAALVLCSGFARDQRCEPGAFSRTATSGADGSFRFAGVPAGDYTIAVRPPAGTKECEGVLSVTGYHVAPARDCPADGRCDLGEVTQCLPFEMPPPR